ncbi:hypothetical protein RJT34_27993 [Clitoria ternatea]|uniref:Uncharacterized protein n=1 Tax=Clitoria ternatea TaxID=43366 RepID=A0AAN9ICB5_CLITE
MNGKKQSQRVRLKVFVYRSLRGEKGKHSERRAGERWRRVVRSSDGGQQALYGENRPASMEKRGTGTHVQEETVLSKTDLGHQKNFCNFAGVFVSKNHCKQELRVF